MGATELVLLIVMIVLAAYFFVGVDLVGWITGGSGKISSIPDKVFRVVRFVAVALLILFSTLLVVTLVMNR
ncbi:MAG: hypothetical protein EOP85_23555 [Verrucomicrobiaceae bacterium]|nr:MAG: hypothetical protein EOP85_23555 [Verrucomicrobiaceae bacterium]